MYKLYVSVFSLILIAACSAPNQSLPPPVTPVEIRTVQVRPPSPIVPNVDPLRLRDVNWLIVTPSNIDQAFERVQTQDGDSVLFSITPSGYEALSLNLSDIRALIEQQRRIIAIYRANFQ
jgi:hypothetical protein